MKSFLTLTEHRCWHRFASDNGKHSVTSLASSRDPRTVLQPGFKAEEEAIGRRRKSKT